MNSTTLLASELARCQNVLKRREEQYGRLKKRLAEMQAAQIAATAKNKELAAENAVLRELLAGDEPITQAFLSKVFARSFEPPVKPPMPPAKGPILARFRATTPLK